MRRFRRVLGVVGASSAHLFGVPTVSPNGSPWSVCSDPLIGVDVSHWQGTAIDWAALRAAGVGWAVVKAWHGRSVVNSWAQQFAGAARAGVELVGRYAWWLPDADLSMQVGAWTGGPFGRGDGRGELPLTIDVEEAGTRLRGRALLDPLEALVSRVADRIGQAPILYTGDWYWRDFLGDLDSPIVAACPLWLAAYPRKSTGGTRYREAVAEVCGGALPRVPRPWADRGLAPVAWQFDGDRGLVLPTTGADVDINTAAGAQLRALAWPTPARELLSDLSLTSAATPIRAAEGEHTPRTRNDE